MTFGTRLSAKRDAITREWLSLVTQRGFARYVPAKTTPMSDLTLFLSHGSKNLIDYSGRALTCSAPEQTTDTSASEVRTADRGEHRQAAGAIP